MPDIHWYPGHMARSRRLLAQQLKLADVIIELCDARAPAATRNPDLSGLARQKVRILVLTKADLAWESDTAQWIRFYKSRGYQTVRFSNAGRRQELMAAIDRATRAIQEKNARRGVKRTLRAIVVGIPNVGKSTFINQLYGRQVLLAQDRPGVTRSNHWVRVGEYLEVLDTPGLLPPKLNNQEAAQVLAWLGTVPDQNMDLQDLAGALLVRLSALNPEGLKARFRLSEVQAEGHELLEAACSGRGWLMNGGRPDLGRAAQLVLDEFRAGKVGRITLQRAPTSAAPQSGAGATEGEADERAR